MSAGLPNLFASTADICRAFGNDNGSAGGNEAPRSACVHSGPVVRRPDRASVIRFRDGPWRSEQLDSRLAMLQDTYWSLRPWVVKQIRRGKFLEAFGY